jgi:hypothetical protein
VPSAADQDLIERLAALGVRVSAAQLERWRAAGLLPGHARRWLGRGLGSVSVLAEETVAVAAAPGRHARPGRDLRWTVIAWYAGGASPAAKPRPATWEQCAAFLRGCGIHRRRMRPWQEAWQRIHIPARAEQPASAAQRAARGSLRNEASLSVHVRPLADGSWLQPWDQSAVHEPYGLAVMDRYDRREAAADSTVSRVYAGLDPAEQHTVLTAGLTHLVTARGRARRNGTAPDTGIDAIAVRDGKLHLLQC